MVSMILTILLFGCTDIHTPNESDSGSHDAGSEETTDIIEGKLSTLEAVYISGFITKRDLLDIAYYNGDSKQNDDLISSDYQPKEIKALESKIERSIKYALAMSFSLYYQSGESYYGEKIRGFKYLGEYNGYYAVVYGKGTWGLDLIKQDYVIGGVRLVETSEKSSVKLWRRADYKAEKVQAEKQTVKVIIGSYAQEVKIESGEAFTRNDLPAFHKEFIKGIYTDSECLHEYGKSPITQDVTLYVKLKSKVEFGLTKELYSRIMTDIRMKKLNQIGVVTYYLGKYKDYEIIEIYLQRNDIVEGVGIKEIACGKNVLRWKSNVYPIYAWKDGEVYDLQELYNLDVLDEGDWVTIIQEHNEMHPEMKKYAIYN